MKRIEAFFQFGKLESVIEEIEKIGVNGVTVFYARGRGEAERRQLNSSRGTSTTKQRFNVIDCIVTIVDDNLVESVSNTIIKYADVDGIVIVSNVDNVTKF